MSVQLIEAAHAALVCLQSVAEGDYNGNATERCINLRTALAAAEAPTVSSDKIACDAWKLRMVYFDADGHPVCSREPEPADMAAAEARPATHKESLSVEPVAWRVRRSGDERHELFVSEYNAARRASSFVPPRQVEPLYASPAAPAQVPLTDQQIIRIMESCLNAWDWMDFARAIERAHSIGSKP
jgi:hypothetical protein